MNHIANKRKLAEAVQVVIKAREIQPEQLQAVFMTLAQVVTDVTGQECQLILQFKADTATDADAGGGA